MRTVTLFVLGTVLLAITGCDRTESDWKSAQQANTVAAYTGFMAKHPQGPRMDEVKKAIEELDWKDANAKNTVDLFNAYLVKYAQGRYVADAKMAVDELDWAQAKAAKTVEAVDSYLKTHVSGKHAGDAAALREMIVEHRAWEEAKSANTGSAFQAYLAKYPLGRHVTEAKQGIELYAQQQKASLRRAWAGMLVTQSSYSLSGVTQNGRVEFADRIELTIEQTGDPGLVKTNLVLKALPVQGLEGGLCAFWIDPSKKHHGRIPSINRNSAFNQRVSGTISVKNAAGNQSEVTIEKILWSENKDKDFAGSYLVSMDTKLGATDVDALASEPDFKVLVMVAKNLNKPVSVFRIREDYGIELVP